MAVDLTILVGTMTGTAEIVAEEINDELAEAGHAIEIMVMDDLDSAAFAGGGLFLICTSTYGQGDVPDNAMNLYEDLQAKRPDLSAVRYGVIALGDKTYADTFCRGGRRFDAILAELKAVRVGERFEHDASSGTVPEEEGVEWARGWIETVDGAPADAA